MAKTTKPGTQPARATPDHDGAELARAGSVLDHAPAAARFDVASGVIDILAPAEELDARDGPASDVATESGLDAIVLHLRTATGHDFAPYKDNTLYRRIERRMGLHQLRDIADYVRYLHENSAEGELLFKELLIGVTSFFRDTAPWERLKLDVLPRLIASSAGNAVIRAWVPACSTGEEAYSLVICFKEALEALGGPKDIKLQVFATDLDASAIQKARRGVYTASIAGAVSPERLERFFVEEDNRYRITKEVRDRVIFATQDILQDPPFTKLDLLTCRNLLIYLTAEAQRKLVPLFHYSLKPGGTLVLGSAETIAAPSLLFAPLDSSARLYRRIDPAVGAAGPLMRSPLSARTRERDAAAHVAPAPQAREETIVPNIQATIEAVLLERFAPAGLLVSPAGDVLFVSGSAEAYLEVPAGRTNWNVLAMASDGLRHAIAGALEKATRIEASVTIAGAHVDAHGEPQKVTMIVEPLDDPPALRGMFLILFAEVATSSEAPVAGGKLRQAREGILARRDGSDTAQEELRCTNEELQSTNEELMTSKEEMQSMNEELETLNAELQARVDDLSRASSEMRNMLDSTAIAVVFLDDSLRIRRFTPQAATLIKLIPSDVGRPLADLATTLDYRALYDDAREVLRTLVFKETIVNAGDGRRFRVRIMPYRTNDNRIDGVVITFVSSSVAGTD